MAISLSGGGASAQDAAPAPAPAEPAPAQAAPTATNPVVVVMEPSARATAVEPTQVRAAVAAELGAAAVPLSDPSARRARGTLTIALDAERRLVVVFRDVGGREVWRTVTVPDDPAAVVATIALIAGNLARDEAGQILSELAPPEPEPPPLVLAPAPEPAPVRREAAPLVIVREPSARRDESEPAPNAEPRARTDRWAVQGFFGAAFSGDNFSPRFEIDAQYRLRWLALGLAFTSSHEGDAMTDWSTRESINHDRHSLVATAEVRWRVGPFYVDTGLGLGGLAYSFTSDSSSYSDLVPYARMLNTIALPIFSSVDLIARVDQATTFGSLSPHSRAGGDPSATSPEPDEDRGPFEIGVSIGARGRFP